MCRQIVLLQRLTDRFYYTEDIFIGIGTSFLSTITPIPLWFVSRADIIKINTSYIFYSFYYFNSIFSKFVIVAAIDIRNPIISKCFFVFGHIYRRTIQKTEKLFYTSLLRCFQEPNLSGLAVPVIVTISFKKRFCTPPFIFDATCFSLLGAACANIKTP